MKIYNSDKSKSNTYNKQIYKEIQSNKYVNKTYSSFDIEKRNYNGELHKSKNEKENKFLKL